jgi:hypothetical protein
MHHLEAFVAKYLSAFRATRISPDEADDPPLGWARQDASGQNGPMD